MTRLLGTTLLLSLALAGPATALPPNLDGIAYTQRTGHRVPQQVILRDENGGAVRLSDLVRAKPLILILGYFRCPNLCDAVRADLFHALEKTDLVGGHDYQLVSLSIDPAETSRDAATAKAHAITRFPAAGATVGWHFLTARAAAVQAIANAVGFADRSDPARNQFLHPTGVVFVAPSGVISSYLLGVGYSPGDVRLAITRAERGTVQAAALPVLLLCYDYDESTGHYSLAIMKLVRLVAVLTVLTLGATLFLAFRRDRATA
jgi:protein SCO1/2